jgi:hypothetical protein
VSFIGNQALPFNPLATSGKPRDAQRFNGNGSTTTFTLTHPVTNPTDLEVFVENVQQEPSFAYDATGTQLIFTEAPPSGTNNVYVIYRNIEPGIYASIPDGAITFNKLANNIRLFTTDNFTGDNTTVTFGLSSVVPDANTLIVAVDGVFQRAPIHYTASGNTITFASAPPATSNVHVRHLGFRTTQSITALPANTTISQPILQNLTATGVSTFTGNVSVSGTSTFTGNVSVTGEITGNVNFDSNTLFVDSVNNEVGIGTNNPGDKLEIIVPAISSYDGGLMLTNSQNWGWGSAITFRTVLTDGGSVGNAARIRQQYESSNNYTLEFATTGSGTLTTQARISSAGNLQFNSGYGSIATAYGCRAWVNFNGTGTIAIRGSGNVSSIADNGTGNYSVNLTTAMPDSNYAAIGAGGISGDYTAVKTIINSTTQFNVDTSNDNRSWTDALFVFGAVFR